MINWLGFTQTGLKIGVSGTGQARVLGTDQARKKWGTRHRSGKKGGLFCGTYMSVLDIYVSPPPAKYTPIFMKTRTCKVFEIYPFLHGT